MSLLNLYLFIEYVHHILCYSNKFNGEFVIKALYTYPSVNRILFTCYKIYQTILRIEDLCHVFTYLHIYTILEKLKGATWYIISRLLSYVSPVYHGCLCIFINGKHNIVEIIETCIFSPENRRYLQKAVDLLPNFKFFQIFKMF